MRRIYKPGRSNVLANNAMVATSQPLSSQEAIDLQRSFALNGKLKIEKSFSEALINDLSNLGHIIQVEEGGIGGGQGIVIDRKDGLLIGGSDSRKDGLAIGY